MHTLLVGRSGGDREHGADVRPPDLRHVLATGCPLVRAARRHSASITSIWCRPPNSELGSQNPCTRPPLQITAFPAIRRGLQETGSLGIETRSACGVKDALGGRDVPQS